MRILVRDDAYVHVTVNTRAVQRCCDRLEEILVCNTGNAVLQGDLVGIVASQIHAVRTTRNRTGLDVSDFWIIFSARLSVAQVVQLQIRVLLGEAQEIRPIVHAVVRHEKLNDGRVNVSISISARTARMNKDGRIAPFAGRPARLPFVLPWENVLTHSICRSIGCRGRQWTAP